MVGKSKLHQNNRLVQTSLKILSLILEQSNKLQYQEEQTSLHEKKEEHKKRNRKREIKSKSNLSFGSNEIIKKVSSDRSSMFEVLKYLNKIRILKENKNLRRGKKQEIQLTLLGFEIADIVYYMNKYNKIYSELEEIQQGKMSSLHLRHKDRIEKIKYINYISYALTSLQINEFYILMTSYAKIYYSYRESISSDTLLFLQTIILYQINIQFNKWFNTIVKKELIHFTDLDEKEFNFRKLISRNLGGNYLDILKVDYSFDNEVEDKVKNAIGIMLRISRPIFYGETYLPSLDEEELDIIKLLQESQDLAKINFSKLKDVEKLIYLQGLAESDEKKYQEFRKKITV